MDKVYYKEFMAAERFQGLQSVSWRPMRANGVVSSESEGLEAGGLMVFQFEFGLLRWLSDKECACNAGDMGSTLYGEDPLEKEMATHSGILAWEIPLTEKNGGLHSMGLQKIWTRPSN